MASPILVRATLITLAAGLPCIAGAQEADADELAPSRAEQTGGVLTVEVNGRGSTADEAHLDAVEKLRSALKRALPEIDPLQLPSEQDPTWIDAAVVDAAPRGSRFVERLSLQIDDVGALQQVTTIGTFRAAPRVLPRSGMVVLAVDVGLSGFRVGDVLTTTQSGQRLDDGTALRRLLGTEKIHVLRGEQPVVVDTTPKPIRTISHAPTCGPCCHGHCQDALKAPGFR